MQVQLLVERDRDECIDMLSEEKINYSDAMKDENMLNVTKIQIKASGSSAF